MFGFSWLYGKLFVPSLFFDDSAGGGGSGSSTENGSGAGGGEKPDADKSTGDDKEDKGKQPQKVTFTADQQAEVDRIVKERLERERRKSEEASEKARKKADDEALQKNQDFEKLAISRQTKIEELETQVKEFAPVQEQLKAYQEAVAVIVKAQVDKLPKAVKSLVEKMDALEQMKYLNDNAKELNIDFKTVPETETDDANPKLRQEEVAKARRTAAETTQRNF